LAGTSLRTTRSKAIATYRRKDIVLDW
jgi:Cation efflux family